jgi:glycosyltransferase involved in cell wall biosynthesis
MALTLKWLTGVKFIFDMRGFWVDERVDGGLWLRNGYMFRFAKAFERRFLLSSDHVVSLTQAAIREMKLFDYLEMHTPHFTVIPTCADLARFKPLPSETCRQGFVLGYVGTVGTWYLFDDAVRCFVNLLRLQPDARFLILNLGEHDFIRSRLVAAGLPDSVVELTSTTFMEMPEQLARMDAGVFFIKPVFSKQASSPTKMAEFLGCGIPCLSNKGVGDMAELIEGEKVGVTLTSFDEDTMINGLNRLIKIVADPNTHARCVATAQKYFSLEEGVAKYRKIYERFDG